MIPYDILKLIKKTLTDNKTDFISIKTKFGEMNVDTFLKDLIVKIVKNNLEEINKHLPAGCSILDIRTGEEYFKLKNNSSDVSDLSDLVLTFCINNEIFDKEVEVKKTKNDIIPGSSIAQINPKKAVIFLQIKKDNVEIEAGFYAQIITSNIGFPDRKPRPQISFKQLKENNKSLDLGNETLEEVFDNKSSFFDYEVEKELPKEWVKDIFSKKDTWFINALRRFSILIIERFMEMSDEEKASFLKETKK